MANLTKAERHNKMLHSTMEHYRNHRAEKAKANAYEILQALESANFVLKKIVQMYPQTSELLNQQWMKDYQQQIDNALSKI